jgi:hypothetical protein
LNFTVKLPEAMKYGTIHKVKNLQQYQIISGDLPEGTLKAILKQAGISVEDFLKAK